MEFYKKRSGRKKQMGINFKRIALVLIPVFACMFWAQSAPAAAITVKSDVSVDGNRIYLKDILETCPDAGLKKQAEGILIGKAPRPGKEKIKSTLYRGYSTK